MAKCSRQPRGALPRGRPDLVAASMLGGDPCRDEGPRVPALLLFLEKRAEAQSGQFVHHDVLQMRGAGALFGRLARIHMQPALGGPQQ
jgi:hypothetical protein